MKKENSKSETIINLGKLAPKKASMRHKQVNSIDFARQEGR